MGDGLAARHVRPRALRVEMDPLAVFGRLGEPVDPVLVDLNPVADAEFLTDPILKVGECCDLQHGGRPPLKSRRDPSR